jgi:uncharacterized protein (DUF924 family)
MRDTQSEILKFWFEETEPEQWFQKNSDFDAAIRNRFDNDYAMAMDGIYDGWMDTPKGCLALIILLDQFPRNMFRDRLQMFASDGKALSIAKHAVAKGFDKDMTLHEKVFTYLPFEHSENLDDQIKSLELFAPTRDENPLFYDYAKKHYDVIKKFGRFPHRNAILERQSTKLEEEYLAKPGSGF